MTSISENNPSRRRFIKSSAAIGVGLSAAACANGASVPATDEEPKGILNQASEKLLQDFGLKYPIFQAAPGGIDLAIAVANAGGMGAVSLSWVSPEVAANIVTRMNSETDGNYYANFVLHFSPSALDATLEAGCPVVQFSWGLPSKEMVSKIRTAKARFGVQVSSKLGAEEALKLAPDFLIAQGLEAGGHVQATSSLSAALQEILDVAGETPVIASGGISTGEDIRNVIYHGAAGAILGTRLMATQESNGHQRYKDALVAAGDASTSYTNCFNKNWDATHRILKNGTFRNWDAAGCPLRGNKPGEEDIVATHPQLGDVTRYSIMYPVEGHEGDVEDLAMYAGDGVSTINDVPRAVDLIERLWDEFNPA